MSTYTLKKRQIPLDDSWDVIVVGGGPAGCTAATAAAREGAKTLLIEATGALGGMGTVGLVPAWCPFSDKERVIYGGLAEKVFWESRKGVPHVPNGQWDWVPINPEQLKRVYDDMVTEAGAKVLFHTFLSAVETDEAGGVSTIVVANKVGLSACKSKVYVDCTGDGDLAAWAGAEFQQGQPETGELQPATHCFILSNVDYWAYASVFHRRDVEKLFSRIANDPKYPDVVDCHSCRAVIGPNTMGFNAGHLWDVDNTDPFNVSAAMIKGRKIAVQLRDALAEYAPETFGGAFLAATGTLMGIRETRRIVGDYVLTIEDYLRRRTFDDEICRNCYWIDVHTAKSEIEKAKTGASHVINRFDRYKPGESHGIPYRCLTPKGLVNVLVAGRSISCDRPVQGSVRVMPVCLAMGEAAGVAAAFAAATDPRNVHAVDVAKLRETLRAYGAYLP